MDNTTQTLANYVTSLQYDQLPASAIHETKKRLVDAIACAIGGYTSEPAQIARRVAANNSGTPPARLFGTGKQTSMEMAAFANAVADSGQEVRLIVRNEANWTRASARPLLAGIAVPTLVLNARDDPFVPEAALPRGASLPAAVVTEFPAHGGHVAFVSGQFPGRLDWLPARVFGHFDAVMSAKSATGAPRPGA